MDGGRRDAQGRDRQHEPEAAARGEEAQVRPPRVGVMAELLAAAGGVAQRCEDPDLGLLGSVEPGGADPYEACGPPVRSNPVPHPPWYAPLAVLAPRGPPRPRSVSRSGEPMPARVSRCACGPLSGWSGSGPLPRRTLWPLPWPLPAPSRNRMPCAKVGPRCVGESGWLADPRPVVRRSGHPPRRAGSSRSVLGYRRALRPGQPRLLRSRLPGPPEGLRRRSEPCRGGSFGSGQSQSHRSCGDDLGGFGS